MSHAPLARRSSPRRTTRSARRWWPAVGVLVALVAAGCSEEDGEAAPSGPPLSVGSCLDLPESGGLSEEDEPVVDCAGPHDAEVFHAVEFDDAGTGFRDPAVTTSTGDDGAAVPYPGADALGDAATAECQQALERYTGLSLLQLDLAIRRIVPTEVTWAEGDRWLVCFAQRGDGGQLEGTIAAGSSTTPPTVAVALPEPGRGQCYLLNAAGDLAGAEVVPCEEPHAGEVYAVVTVGGPDDPFPGVEEIRALAGTECAAAIAPYVGGPLPDNLRATSFNPTEDGWALGDRTVNCAIVVPDGGLFTGSAAGLIGG